MRTLPPLHSQSSPAFRRLALLLLLFLVALGLRTFRAFQEPVVNPDTIRFIDQAKLLAVHPLLAVRQEVYHPLHSAAGLLVHTLIAGAFANDRIAWLISMQIVGILCGAIVALQIVSLSRWIGAPFWAALGAGFVWTVGRRTSAFGADGLSDMLFLCLFTAAMLLGFRALRGFQRVCPRCLAAFLAAGLLGGLAYLARPEGLGAPLILAITIVMLALPRPRRVGGPLRLAGRAFKLMPRIRPAPRLAALAMMALLLGAAIPSVPYMLAIGKFTAKLDEPTARAPAAETLAAPAAMAAIVAEPHATLLHIGRLVMELWETFGFAPWLVLLLALPLRPRLWGRARLRLVVVVWAVLWIALMLWVLERKSYLDGRHTLALVVLLHGLLALALSTWATAARYHGLRLRGRSPAWAARVRNWGPMAGGTACFLAALPGMIRLGTPPLNDQYYIARAAQWIKTHVRPNVTICDDELRIGYYSGHPYALWEGLTIDPRLAELAEARRPGPGGQPHPIVAGEIYRPGNGDTPLSQIGPYVEIARFHSLAAAHGDVLVLYARPEDHVMMDGDAAAAATGPASAPAASTRELAP
ncbi:MAG TPA: hypothetical protein VH253_05505 [Phycisphaerae bacterium]|nr:hypothetical protein [Phycisphaerae bacterium]